MGDNSLLTPWLSHEIRPTLTGWYERLYIHGAVSSYFDGKLWYVFDEDKGRTTVSALSLPWRGLTSSAYNIELRRPGLIAIFRAVQTESPKRSLDWCLSRAKEIWTDRNRPYPGIPTRNVAS